MDHLFDWIDSSSVFQMLGHTWVWSSITAAAALISIAGIAHLARHYGDASNRAHRAT